MSNKKVEGQTLVTVKGYTYARKSEYKKEFGQKKVPYTVTLLSLIHI